MLRYFDVTQFRRKQNETELSPVRKVLYDTLAMVEDQSVYLTPQSLLTFVIEI
jgi:hypothetical protein